MNQINRKKQNILVFELLSSHCGIYYDFRFGIAYDCSTIFKPSIQACYGRLVSVR